MESSKDEANGYTKKDWALFREKLPEWQEVYIEKLIEEYIELLSSDESASDKFWTLKKRIDADRHRKGVRITLGKPSEMLDDLVALYYEGTITEDDLDEFSDILKDQVKRSIRLWKDEYSDTGE